MIDQAELCGIVNMRPAFTIDPYREDMAGAVPDTGERGSAGVMLCAGALPTRAGEDSLQRSSLHWFPAQ